MPESHLESDLKPQGGLRGEEVPERSLRDMCNILFRHKGKLALVLLAVMLTVGWYTFLPPRVYESHAELFVRVGRDAVLDHSGSETLIASAGPSDRSQIDTEVGILGSRGLVEKVIDTIGLSAFIEHPEALEASAETAQEVTPEMRSMVTRAVMKKLSVKAEGLTNIVTISYRASSPELAQQVVARLIDLYLDKHAEMHRSPGSYDFFADQIEQVRVKLARDQASLRDLRNETGITSTGEQNRVILSRISDLQREIERTGAEASASSAKIWPMEKKLAELPETLVMSETTRLSLGREEPSGTVTKGINIARQTLSSTLLAEKANLASLQARAETLEDQLAVAKEELRVVNRNAARFAELEREINIQEAKYRSYSDNLEKARVGRTLETERISNVSVLQPASLPAEPVPRQGRRKLAMGLLLGLVAGVGVALMADRVNHTLKDPRDVESKLHLRTMASVPYLSARAVSAVKGLLAATKKETAQLAAGEGRMGTTTGTGEPMALAVPSEVIDLYDYDDLPDRLFLTPDGSEELPRVLALTSCYSGEGVTTVGSHLAVLLAANSDGRVLFVDANLRRPSAHLVFGLNTSPGLTEFLIDGQSSAEIVQPSGVPNLDVVTAGERNISFSRRSEFTALHDLVGEWRSKYRFVLLDTPAVRGGMFAGLLGSLVDGVVLVVEAERVRWEVVRRVHEPLLRAKANVLGVALNKRKYYVPEWLYKRL